MASPADRVSEEGGSTSLVKLVGRADHVAPRVAGPIGFAATAYARFGRHRGSVLAGGLAFFGMLSIVPAFLSLAVLAGVLVDPARFADDFALLMVGDPERVEALEPVVGYFQAGQTPLRELGIAGLASLAVSLYAASRFVYVGRQVLDVAFELEPEPPNLISRAMAIVTTVVVEGAVILGVIVGALIPRFLEMLGIGEVYGETLRFVRLPLATISVYLMLTAAMRFGIRARRVVRWGNLGAAVGTAIIVVGTSGLGWYLSISVTYSRVVAVLGGMIAVEIWLYLVGMAIVVSAEIEGIRHGFRRRDRVLE